MFLLQQGYGMLTHSNNFLPERTNSGIILSPRACERSQLENHIENFRRHNAQIYFDPQFYEPRTDLERILSYPYWDDYDFQTNTFDSGEFCKKVIDYQKDILKLNNIILPGRYINSLTESWTEMQHEFAEVASTYATNCKIFSTLALGPDIILNSENFDTIIDELVNYPIDGVYFVFEHPNNEFLINDEDFLYVLLDGLLDVSLSNKKIILGYANQQSIIFAAAGVDYIVSGNFRNVRSFDHLNFSERDMDLRRAKWYFDGNTLGEYRLQKLSLAYRRGLAHFFGPPTEFSREMLSSQRPADYPWREGEAFCHYFEVMYQICQRLDSFPKKERAENLIEFFNTVSDNNQNLIQNRFNPGQRGFHEVLDATLGALESFIGDRESDIDNLGGG